MASGAKLHDLRSLHPARRPRPPLKGDISVDIAIFMENRRRGPGLRKQLRSMRPWGSRRMSVGSPLDGPGSRMTHIEQWLHQSLCQLKQ